MNTDNNVWLKFTGVMEGPDGEMILVPDSLLRLSSIIGVGRTMFIDEVTSERKELRVIATEDKSAMCMESWESIMAAIGATVVTV